MARARVMYWKEIPVQVQATDAEGQVSRPLDDRFQEGADAIAMIDGSAGSDAYLDALAWSKAVELPGAAKEVATELAERYNERFPTDFVARTRRLQKDGTRDPRPGAVDHWLDEK